MIAFLACSATPALALYRYPFVTELGPFNAGGVYNLATNGFNDETLVQHYGQVEVFDSSWSQIATWNGSAAANPPGTPSGEFGTPALIAANDNNGKSYVADSTPHLIDILGANGEYLAQFDGSATPAHSFGSIGALAVDQSNGDVYVSDVGNAVVDVFDETGAYLRQITSSGTPVSFAQIYSIAVDAGNGDVFLAESTSIPSTITSRVYEFDAAGQYVQTLDGSATPAGSFGCGRIGVAVRNSDHHLFVTSAPSKEGELCGRESAPALDEFDAAGSYIGRITQLPGNESFAPFGVAISQTTGDEYVINTFSRVDVFKPGQVYPDVNTGSATSVTPTGAILNGSVNPDGLEVTSCYFEYGTSTSYGQTAPCAETVGSGSGEVHVHADVSGLQSGSAYHFRLVAENVHGPTEGDDQQFGPPLPSREGTDALTPTAATLHAAVMPDNLETTYHFEYGTTTSYGSSTPESLPVGSDLQPHPVSAEISGLSAGTTYHFRVVATNSSGTTAGPDATFATLPPLLIDAQPAASIGTSSAILQAYLDPLGQSLSACRFEYIEAAHYEPAAAEPYAAGGTLPCEGAVPSGSSPELLEARLAGLHPGTEYDFRLSAADPLGAVAGPDEGLTTEPAPGSCENEARREEQGKSALALPQCRAYEQVSPRDKSLYPVAATLAVSPNGNRASFTSFGAFAGAATGLTGHTYLAERGGEGWHSAAVDPPDSLGISPNSLRATAVGSPDLSEFLSEFLMSGVTNQDDALRSGRRAALFIRRQDGSFSQASPVLERLDGGPLLFGGFNVLRTAPDFSQIFIDEGYYPLIPSDTAPLGTQHLYEIAGATGPSPTLRLVAVDNSGQPLANCPFVGSPQLGADHTDGGTNAVSRDGSTVFFSVDPPDCSNNREIFARLNGQTTVSISDPQPNAECTTPSCTASPASAARFVGASPDGSRAFFISTRQLTDAAGEDPAPRDNRLPCTETTAANGCNLYEYDFSRPPGHNLVALSTGDWSGLGPQVRGVLPPPTGVSEDGSHVYFVARGLLTPQPNALGQVARAGAENLYVYDTSRATVAFVADLCSGEGRSGALAAVAQCPSEAETSDGRLLHSSGLVDLTPDGRYLVFTTFAQLTPDDTDAAADVYRYDARSGSLVRLSVGHDGQDSNGNDQRDATAGAGAVNFGPSSHIVSDDGSTVIFTTTSPLESGDENEAADLYEWHQGEVAGVSGARSAQSRLDSPFITPSGRDIFFVTEAGLVFQDVDRIGDLYDARIGGGFPPEPPPPPICEAAETCHGAGTGAGAPPDITHLEAPGNPFYCHRGLVRRHGKCVRKHHRKRKPRHHKRKHRRAAARPHGGSR